MLETAGLGFPSPRFLAGSAQRPSTHASLVPIAHRPSPIRPGSPRASTVHTPTLRPWPMTPLRRANTCGHPGSCPRPRSVQHYSTGLPQFSCSLQDQVTCDSSLVDILHPPPSIPPSLYPLTFLYTTTHTPGPINSCYIHLLSSLSLLKGHTHHRQSLFPVSQSLTRLRLLPSLFLTPPTQTQIQIPHSS